MFAPVYLDYNATTPVLDEVREAMLPYFSQRFGNASSRHEYGRAARLAIDTARERVAAALGAHPTEVVFTSGGSESNNLFIKGAAARMKPGVVAVSAVEHPCVREPARALARRGWALHEIAVDANGIVRLDDFDAALAQRPGIVSVMLANNETGVVQDIAGLAQRAASGSGWFHSDAVQALGKLPVDFRRFNQAGVHALSVSSHKIGGPKGAAALVLDKRIELEPLIAGGGHERGLRSGTENVPAIVGFGVACELAAKRVTDHAARLSSLQAMLEGGLAAQGAVVFGLGAERLPNTVYFAMAGIDGETLVGQIDRAGYAVASGAACSSANPEPSHVLLAMGVAPELARGAVRVSLGPDSTAATVDGFLLVLNEKLRHLRGLTALAA
ncbi:MAG TPA: cysteine desulfurase family protein [Rhodocyclaceae bacterium]